MVAEPVVSTYWSLFDEGSGVSTVDEGFGVSTVDEGSGVSTCWSLVDEGSGVSTKLTGSEELSGTVAGTSTLRVHQPYLSCLTKADVFL